MRTDVSVYSPRLTSLCRSTTEMPWMHLRSKHTLKIQWRRFGMFNRWNMMWYGFTSWLTELRRSVYRQMHAYTYEEELQSSDIITAALSLSHTHTPCQAFPKCLNDSWSTETTSLMAFSNSKLLSWCLKQGRERGILFWRVQEVKTGICE